MSNLMITYYFASLVLLLSVVVVNLLKTSNWASFAVFFPVFFVMYLMLAPLGIIFGESSMFFNPLIHEVVPIYNDSNIFIVHNVCIIFLASWFLGYGRIFSYSLKVYDYRPVKIASDSYDVFSATVLIILLHVFALTFLSNLWGVLYSGYESGASLYIYYSTEAGLSTIVKASHGLWAASILSLFVFWASLCRNINWIKFLLIIHVSLYVLTSLMLGDRGQLVVLMISVAVVYNRKVSPIRLGKKFVFIVSCLLMLLAFIKNTRRVSFFEVLSNSDVSILDAVGIEEIIKTIAASAENVSSYISLYFVTISDIPLLYGKSFIALLFSFVPRIIYPERPSSISYEYYSEYANLDDRGYTLSQVADWYLNFGVFGVFVGGLVLGFVMKAIERPVYTKYSISEARLAVFALFCGWLPQLLRTGIEGYKVFIYEYLSVPLLCFVVIPYIRRQMK